jgi:hypothetical protein
VSAPWARDGEPNLPCALALVGREAFGANRAFAALLAGANGLAPWRFFAFNAAGGIVWATTFGLGGYVLGGHTPHRRTGWLGPAASGTRRRLRAVALLQEARREPPGEGRTRNGAARALTGLRSGHLVPA